MTRPDVNVPRLGDRTSGILLHPTSLPGPHGSGDLGASARAFAEFLSRAGQRWWQMLPTGPAGYGDSPYSAQSAFAGNPLLLDLTALLPAAAIDDLALPASHVDYERTSRFRSEHLRRAAEAFRPTPAYDAFCEKNRAWLDDFALFSAVKRAHGGVEWTRWEDGIKLRRDDAVARATKEHAAEIARIKFEQFAFAEQWAALRSFCHERGIGLIGDLPIFVAHDSADVWTHPEMFRLDASGMPTVIAGVPPDYFSTTGQRWGNPLYRWAKLKKDGFAWWVDRFRALLTRFDVVRLDHFIGFQRYWEIPANEPTAVNGRWMKGPGRPFFEAVKKALGALPLIAEDLGAVTPAVTRLREGLGLPGIAILQFAFGTDPSAPTFIPYNLRKNTAVYTGTHDNDTTCGWFHDRGNESGGGGTRTLADTEKERQAALRYLGTSGREIHWDMIRLALASVADTAILPMQDVLGRGSEARMNSPGRAAGNWQWRFEEGALTGDIEERLATLTTTYGRGAR